MPLPVLVGVGTVTGTFTNDDGSAAAGKVYFTPGVEYLLDAGDDVVVVLRQHVVTLDATGSFSQVLIATDDTDLNPIDFTWTVRVDLTGKPPYHFAIDVPEGTTRDLADISPVPSSDGDAIVTGPPGPPGTGATNATDAQAIAGTATTVWLSPANQAANTPVQYIKKFGVVGNGITDDTAAFQAAIDQVAVGAGVPPVSYDLGGTVILLTDTIVIDKKALRLLGNGEGNPPDHGTNPGEGTTFRWGGAAGIPMFRIVDSKHVYFSDVYFQGDSTNVPSAAIFFDGGGSVGTNEYLVFERCLFGYLPWNVGGYGLDHCVQWGGTNSNNDQFVFRSCQFLRPVIDCVNIPNSQSIWGSFEDCTFDCNTAGGKGVVTSASVTLYNPQFNGNSIDIEVNGAAQVVVYGWQSERAGKLFDITAGGGRLIVDGGFALLSNITGGFFGTADVLAGGCVDLRGWRLSTGTASPRPQLRVIGASMAGAVPTDATSTVRVVNCTTTKEDYAISSIANGRVKIHVDDMGISDDVYLTGVETYVPGLGKSRQTVYDTAGAKTHWTKRPSSLLYAHIWAHGPGSSGASGRRGAAATVRGGGGGGSPGAIAEGLFSAGELPSSTFSFTIAAAAAGGAAVTANDTNGNPGTIPGNLVVGPLTVVHSSTAAGGGTTSGGPGGTGVANMAGVVGPTGAAGGVGTAPSAGTAGTYGASGGGAGAGISAAEAASAGSAGGATVQRTGYTRTAQSGGTAGTNGGAAAGAGNSPPSTERSGGTGGGGGGSHATNAGQDGAAGGMGGGGGGGGAATNGANSGAGGPGGLAKVIITEYHT